MGIGRQAPDRVLVHVVRTSAAPCSTEPPLHLLGILDHGYYFIRCPIHVVVTVGLSICDSHVISFLSVLPL